MWFVYLDESKENNNFFVYSALVIKGNYWPQAFEAVKAFRKELRDQHGIYIAKELHAWKFAAGKGRISDRVLSKQTRAEVFRQVLRFVANAGYFRVMCSVNHNEEYAFERLMNRLNRTANETENNLLLFCDEGQEANFTQRIRKLRVYNPIPSALGTWRSTGEITQNIPLNRFIEDPIFKDSKASYFIQLVDFVAYALLRMEKPIPSRTALGYDTMYEELKPITTTVQNKRDPRGMGIIR